MRSISGVGVGLSAVFGCLLVALIAELYYLLWWKKRIITKYDENSPQIPSHFFYIFRCWKSPNSSSAQQLCNSSPTLVHEPQPSLWLKHENSMEYFPRFLFTIAEETREDLESEDGAFRNRKQSNLSDLLHTPFLTPPASPPYFTPPLTPSFSDYQQSPFFESEKDAEFNRLRCSPPPKLKFLRDAEEKQARKTGESEENGRFITLDIDGDGNCRNR